MVSDLPHTSIACKCTKRIHQLISNHWWWNDWLCYLLNPSSYTHATDFIRWYGIYYSKGSMSQRNIVTKWMISYHYTITMDSYKKVQNMAVVIPRMSILHNLLGHGFLHYSSGRDGVKLILAGEAGSWAHDAITRFTIEGSSFTKIINSQD